MGVCNCSMFCCTLLYVHSSFAIILMGKRDLVALLSLSSWCLVMVVWLFLSVPWVFLQFVVTYFLIILNIFYVGSNKFICPLFGVKIIHMYGAHTKFCGTLLEMNETMTPVYKVLYQSLDFVYFDSLCPSQQFFSHLDVSSWVEQVLSRG